MKNLSFVQKSNTYGIQAELCSDGDWEPKVIKSREAGTYQYEHGDRTQGVKGYGSDFLHFILITAFPAPPKWKFWASQKPMEQRIACGAVAGYVDAKPERFLKQKNLCPKCLEYVRSMKQIRGLVLMEDLGLN